MHKIESTDIETLPELFSLKLYLIFVYVILNNTISITSTYIDHKILLLKIMHILAQTFQIHLFTE